MLNLEYNNRVKQALSENKPVVALESTIISHGLPYPDNVECAKLLENTVMEAGAVPATIGIMNGIIKIGLEGNEIISLAKAEHVVKVSRQDIAYVLAKKLNGATTVAGTMILANLAGIKFFATGGIGGVHRNAENTFDISADLEELGQTQVAVVSAGAKAILDISKTLEYLETKGVPVVGYNTDTFPLFYTSSSDYNLIQTADNQEQMANIVKTKFDILNLKGGILIANPIPKQYELEYDYINELIEKTVEETIRKKITGKEVTPYILSRISELTENKSVEVNIELVKNNAKVCSEIAIEYYK